MSALPYGTGLGMGQGDFTGVVGQESQVDNTQKFEPLPSKIKVSSHPNESLVFDISIISSTIYIITLDRKFLILNCFKKKLCSTGNNGYTLPPLHFE